MSENAEPVGGIGALTGTGMTGAAGYFQQAPATAVRGRSPYQSSGNGKGVAAQDAGFGEAMGDSLELSPEAEQQLRELKQRDAEVRAHERAHMAAAGQHAIGGAQYTYQVGPDGRRYAIGGHVNIDTSSVPDDPEASEEKAQQVRRAALAPGDPSAQDMQVAAQAAQMEAEARVDSREEDQEAGRNGGAGGDAAGAVDPLTGSLAAAPNVSMASPAGTAGSRPVADPSDIVTERSSRRQAVQAYESASLGFPAAGELPRAAAPSGDGSSWRMTADGMFAAYSSSGSQTAPGQAAGRAETFWSGTSPQRAVRAYAGQDAGAGFSASANVAGSLFSFAV